MTNGVVSARGGRLQKLVMENRKFTNTAIPVFSGTEGWYQHIHIVQAIVKSNGWPEETAALQLFVHLKGEALNVALLLAKKERESWTGLVEGLAAYYQSPGRLAGLRRRFESAFRQPGLDPATFATDLGMLAIQGFGDMREQARDTMIRDKFIAGQEQCALRRQLDGFAQGTPIGEIVDSCRVWESHSDSNWVAKKGYDSEVGNQSGDSRTRERRKVGVVIEEREPEIEGWKESWTQELSGILKKCLGPNGGTPTGGSTCRWEENDAPTVDRSPRVGMVNLEHVRIGGKNWVHGWDPVETHYSQKQRRRPGNERRFGRVGQPLGPLRIKAPLTLGGGGVPSRLKKGCPLGRRRKMMGVAADGRWMIRNSQSWERRSRPERSSDRPIPMTPRWAGDRGDTRYRSPGVWTGGCDRQRTFGQFGKGTVMFGRGVSRNP